MAYPHLEIVVHDFDTNTIGLRLPSHCLMNYNNLLARAYEGLFKSPDLFNAHIHLGNKTVANRDNRVVKALWEQEAYFGAAGKVMHIWVHFVTKEDPHAPRVKSKSSCAERPSPGCTWETHQGESPRQGTLQEQVPALISPAVASHCYALDPPLGSSSPPSVHDYVRRLKEAAVQELATERPTIAEKTKARHAAQSWNGYRKERSSGLAIVQKEPINKDTHTARSTEASPVQIGTPELGKLSKPANLSLSAQLGLDLSSRLIYRAAAEGIVKRDMPEVRAVPMNPSPFLQLPRNEPTHAAMSPYFFEDGNEDSYTSYGPSIVPDLRFQKSLSLSPQRRPVQFPRTPVKPRKERSGTEELLRETQILGSLGGLDRFSRGGVDLDSPRRLKERKPVQYEESDQDSNDWSDREWEPSSEIKRKKKKYGIWVAKK
ncbi:hypothetical protein CC78DRAFT_618808 [Lojkania enalia]|uniref:Uncharacterized protein n=1 Tax=Lojkania enalia TaxID=147567 RepID=A0A9P4K9Z8_9PLEO|nr:hypothetical protein CC78DRAFT_618808 [Didymosphaeria enalia]